MDLIVKDIETYVGLATHEELELIESLTTIHLTYFSQFRGRKEWKTRALPFFDKKRMMFPTGLLPRMKPHLVDVSYYDYRRTPIRDTEYTLNLPMAPSGADYSFQEDILEKAAKYGRGIIISPTGSGKTVIMAKITNHFKCRTTILVPTKLLLNQTYKEFCKWFGEDRVGKAGGGSHEWDKDITICTMDTPYYALKKNPEKFQKWADKQELLMLDECHHVTVDTKRRVGGKWITVTATGNSWWKVAMKIPATYRFGLSATVGKDSANNKFVLEAVTGRVLFEMSVSEAIKRKVLCPVHTTMIKFPVAYIKDWITARETNILLNKKRNALLARIATQKAKEGKKVIVFVDLVEKQGKALHELIPNSIFLWGQSSDKEREAGVKKFEETDGAVLIGTIFGEGFNMPKIDVAIVAGGGKGITGSMQKVGRILRIHPGKEYSELYDIFDDDSKEIDGKIETTVCTKHSKARMKVYKSEEAYEFKIIEANQI